jgi:hypothetical protein
MAYADDKGVANDKEMMEEKLDNVHVEDGHNGNHMTALSEEELAIERKLRRRIDLRIMPLVILVYLMNYIDRYALRLLH